MVEAAEGGRQGKEGKALQTKDFWDGVTWWEKWRDVLHHLLHFAECSRWALGCPIPPVLCWEVCEELSWNWGLMVLLWQKGQTITIRGGERQCPLVQGSFPRGPLVCTRKWSSMVGCCLFFSLKIHQKWYHSELWSQGREVNHGKEKKWRLFWCKNRTFLFISCLFFSRRSYPYIITKYSVFLNAKRPLLESVRWPSRHRCLPCKPIDPSSPPRTHVMVEGESWLHKDVFWHPHACHGTYLCTHKHICTQ